MLFSRARALRMAQSNDIVYVVAALVIFSIRAEIFSEMQIKVMKIKMT